MKNLAWYTGTLALGILIIFAGSILATAIPSTVASAQEATVVPTMGAQEPPVQPMQPVQPVEENNDFPWGLLGLLGLAGLTGLRRESEPVRRETSTVEPTVSGYEKKTDLR